MYHSLFLVHGLNKSYHRYDYNPNMMFELTEVPRLGKCPRSYNK